MSSGNKPFDKNEMIQKKIEKLERKIEQDALNAEEEQKVLQEIANLESQLKNTNKGYSKQKLPRESKEEHIEKELLKSAKEKQKNGKKLDLFEARALFSNSSK